jgi:hypothetical protein
MVSGWWGKGAPSTIKSVYPFFSQLHNEPPIAKCGSTKAKLSKHILMGGHSPPPLPRSPDRYERPSCTAWRPYSFVLNVATRSYYFSRRDSGFCSPFYPPQTPPPVDKSQDSRCPTRPSMRPFSCQAGKPESEAERKREAERNERTADTSPERFRSASGRSRKAEVAAGQRTPCAGRGLTAKSQRRAGYRKQSGKPAILRGRRGAGRRKAERMALEAKDFQDQAQWALVAIPAPIYFQAAIPQAVTADTP